MNTHSFIEDARAISPVVGVALLIATAVILAAVIGAAVLGLDTGGVETPQANMAADLDTTNDGEDAIQIAHYSGDPIPMEQITFVGDEEYSVESDEIVYESGGELDADDEFSAGETIFIQEATEEELAVVWEDPNSDADTIIGQFSD